MEYDINRLTFLANPRAYESQGDETCVRIPAGILSPEELRSLLKERLGLPTYFGGNWSDVRDTFGYWYNLEKNLKQGYKIRGKHLTAQQEYAYRRHPWDKHDFMQ